MILSIRSQRILMAPAWGAVWARAAIADSGVVLDESAYFRQLLCFGVPRYSPSLIHSEGEKVLSKILLADV